MTTQSPTSTTHSQVLFRHRKCPQWGLAVLAWEHSDKRGYQFEDGNLRVFKKGFYSLLEDVEPPADHTQRVLDHLNRTLGRTEVMNRSSAKDVVLIPFADQVDYFKGLYPDGFTDKAWQEKIRGKSAKRALKRHRNPVLALAQKRLGQEVLDRLIDKQDFTGVLSALGEVLDQTNLVQAAKCKPLLSATPYQQQTIALALRELLHGEGELGPRFESFAASLTKPSWELVTAPLALLWPQEHICVKPSNFEQQALWILPRLKHTRAPKATTYLYYLKMARIVYSDLERAEVPPQDMMDLYDFIDVTLRPSARKLLAKKSCARSAQDASPRQPSEGGESSQEAA